VMEREITIALRFKLAIGDVTLNEIVYRLKELRDDLMLRIWVIRSPFSWVGQYGSSPCGSREKSIHHVVALLFIAGMGPLCAGLPVATCVSQAREKGDFGTQGCKTGGVKTYLSPGSPHKFKNQGGASLDSPGRRS